MEGDRQNRITDWITRKVMPCEHVVRAWLARSLVSQPDIDDLIQEGYCRISRMESVEGIARPDAFFFQIVRNLLLNKVRHARIVRIETVAELDDFQIADDAPSPEQVVGSRHDLERVHAQIEALPEPCRKIFQMRRVDDLSQKEIASRLGISENVVEHHIARGLKLVIKALRNQGYDLTDQYPRTQLR
jgi:RNA polymerase sigma-70 factor (ECF subfamily)